MESGFQTIFHLWNGPLNITLEIERESLPPLPSIFIKYQHFSLLAIDFNLNPILSTIITEVFRTMDHHLLLHDDDEGDSMDRESANKRRKRSVSDDGNLLSSDPNSASDSMNHPSGNEVVDCDDEEDFFLSFFRVGLGGSGGRRLG